MSGLWANQPGLWGGASGLVTGGGGPPPPPPVFTVQPSISPGSGPATITLFTANDGTATNSPTFTRRWLLDGVPIGIGTTVTPIAPGSLVLEVTATNVSGSAVATSPAATVGAIAPARTFDFTTGTLDPAATFTRASVGYYVNSSGVWTSAAVNVPRFDYNGGTLAPKGLLIEEARTNLALWSQDMTNAVYNPSRCTKTNATTLTEDSTASNSHLILQTITGPVPGVYTASVEAKAGTRGFACLRFQAGAPGYSVFVNLTTGAVVDNRGTTPTTTHAPVDMGGGWWRFGVTATYATSTMTLALALGSSAADATISANPSYNGNGTGTVQFRNLQLELGSGLSSIIPTTTAPVTRAADVAQVLPGSGFSSWYNQSEGTFVVSYDLLSVASATLRMVMSANDGVGNDALQLQVISAGGNQYRVDVAGGTSAFFAGSASVTTPSKSAGAYKVNDFAACWNGASLGTDTSGAVSSVTAQLNIGCQITGVQQMNGHISRIDYYNIRRSNADMLTLTAVTLLTGFDTSFNGTNLVYSEEARLVTRTDNTGRRAVRGLTGHTTGKWYVELMPLVARFRFAGIVDAQFTTNGGGGPPGTHRVGVEGQDIIDFFGDTPFMFAAPGDVVRLAYDADADLFWVKLNSGDWNDAALADPATGVGGLSTQGLVGPAYVGATLRPVTGASVRYRLPGDVGYVLPIGYTEWADE